MIRVALDTNAYAAFKRGLPEAVEVLRAADTIEISIVVLGELLAGFAGGTWGERNRRELDAFLAARRVRIRELDMDTARFYSQVYVQLKRKGRPIPTNDLWIAAGAMQSASRLFTCDRHFREVEGLLIGSRLADFLP